MCISEQECHEKSYYLLQNGQMSCGYCAELYKIN